MIKIMIKNTKKEVIRSNNINFLWPMINNFNKKDEKR